MRFGKEIRIRVEKKCGLLGIFTMKPSVVRVIKKWVRTTIKLNYQKRLLSLLICIQDLTQMSPQELTIYSSHPGVFIQKQVSQF